jgi:hypothetical protein
MPPPPPSEADDRDIRRSYVRVLVVWIVTLAGLYLFQAYFA